jgi:hypothetical protein
VVALALTLVEQQEVQVEAVVVVVEITGLLDRGELEQLLKVLMAVMDLIQGTVKIGVLVAVVVLVQ